MTKFIWKKKKSVLKTLHSIVQNTQFPMTNKGNNSQQLEQDNTSIEQ